MAGRPRPPRAAVRAAVRACLGDLEPGTWVLVGLSGGPDSLALCAATVRVAQELGLLVAAVIVDHGLQPGAAEVARTAAAQARILGCDDVAVRPVVVTPSGSGLEAAARDARHAALRECARQWQAPVILLGHTRDDQAETVLMRLTRGAGTRSLAGMSKVNDPYRRPLLDLPREVVAAAAAAQVADDPRLAPWNDPHNDDHRFLRSRVRTQLMPQLRAVLGESAVAGLARTAQMAQEDADALDALAAARLVSLVPELVGRPAGEFPVLPVAVLGDLPAISSRVIREFLVSLGCPRDELTREHVTQVGHAMRNRAHRVWLPGGLVAAGTAAGLSVLPRV